MDKIIELANIAYQQSELEIKLHDLWVEYISPKFHSKFGRVYESEYDNFYGGKMKQYLKWHRVRFDNRNYILENGTLNIKEGVEIIDDYSFTNMKITNLTIPNSVKRIGWNAFFNNEITDLIIPNSVKIIESWTFKNNKIEHVKLPDSIKYVSSVAFNNNPLKTITFKGVTYNIKMVDYPFIIESTKTKDSYTIYKGCWFNGIKDNELKKLPCYVAQKDNYTAHGKTIKEAIEDVEYKIYYEKIKKEPIYLDTIINDKLYRVITGSCKLGIKHWRKQNNITKKSYKVAEILPILEKTNAYGLETFKKLIKSNHYHKKQTSWKFHN